MLLNMTDSYFLTIFIGVLCYIIIDEYITGYSIGTYNNSVSH